MFLSPQAMPLIQEGSIGSKWPGIAIKKFLDLTDPEIQTPSTLGKSLGTKIFGQIFFSNHVIHKLFYNFFGFIT